MTALADTADIASARREVDHALRGFLTLKQAALPAALDEAFRVLSTFLDGGKRIRSTLCMMGWRAAGQPGDRLPAARVAASLELFVAFGLIHDDIIDGSDTRRARPAVHKTIGHAGAILLGDLAMAWSHELLHHAPLTADQAARVVPVFQDIFTDAVYGAMLELQCRRRFVTDTELITTINQYKTVQCTTERPLLLGALLAGAGEDILAACSTYAVPMGLAFQLRDDLLGVFGDPLTTGKPTTDDLREGNSTLLLAHALHRATADQATTLRRLVANPDLSEQDAEQVRAILIDTGAKETVEAEIRRLHQQASTALSESPFPGPVVDVLRTLLDQALTRTS